MKNWTIAELLTAGWTPGAIVEYVPEEFSDGRVPKTYIPTPWLQFALKRYGDRVFIYPNETIDSAVMDISLTWDKFRAMHTYEFDRFYRAKMTEYKPLENYSMTETGMDNRTTTEMTTGEKSVNNSETTERTGTVTNEGTTSDSGTRTDNLTDELKRTGTVGTTGETTDTTTQTTTNTGTQTTAGTTANTNSVAAYDTEAFSARDKQDGTTNDTRTDDLTATTTNGGKINSTATTTNNTTDTHTNTGTQNTQNSGTTSNTQTNDTTDTTTLSGTANHTVTGNGTDKPDPTMKRSATIGVTTSQQMLTSEINLRLRNMMTYYVVELFVSQFTTW